MKKVLKSILYASFALFSFVLMTFSSFGLLPYAKALSEKVSNETSSLSSSNFTNTVSTILRDYSAFTNRVAGSEGEKQAYNYIVSYLNSNTALSPLSNDFITNGTQTFRFCSVYDGNYYTSQNIIYEFKSNENTNKKIIIGCSYDAVAFKNSDIVKELVDSQSINGSAGSVALMLALAKLMNFENLPYNVEFVFFGAGSSDNAGSKFYTQGISSKQAEDILLMINIDKIAVGKNLYFYIDEVDNNFSKYLANSSKNGEISLKKLSVKNVGKNLEIDPIGLGYGHIALTSNNVNFMKSKILTMNIFAGDYSNGVTLGLSEFSDKEIVSYTSNDNLDYIKENYGESAVLNNLQNVYDSLEKLLTKEDFVSVCEGSRNQTSWVYTIFANDNLVLFMAIVAIIILFAIAFVITYKLTKRSYYANIEKDFVNSVMNISTNLNAGAPKNDKIDIPDVVTDVLVNDIKKDKQIKRTKKDKDDE